MPWLAAMKEVKAAHDDQSPVFFSGSMYGTHQGQYTILVIAVVKHTEAHGGSAGSRTT